MNINSGVGVFGNRGVLGISVDKFLTPNHVIAGAFGLDFIGATSSLGYKYMTDKNNNSKTFWDKCFFLFECDMHSTFGVSIQYATPTNTKFYEDDVFVREYETSDKWLGIVSFGRRDIYKNNFTVDWEMTYRQILAGGESAQTYGSAHDDRKSLELGYRNLGAGIAVGYLS